ncbi:MAG: VOC family protein [Gammaproteobacteria bacterium]|nr:VOC family protein [Gammaproteobacteria bacterium]
MNLNQITLPITALAPAVAFYKSLGLHQIVASERYARFELPEGDATLSLHVVDNFMPTQTLIYFECDALDDKVRELEAAGVVFDSQPTDQRWLWREARLHDPDGNLLCLFYAGENRKHPPWRVE